MRILLSAMTASPFFQERRCTRCLKKRNSTCDGGLGCMDVHNNNRKNPIRFLKVTKAERLEDVNDLFREYAQSLDIDLCFQN